MGPVTIGRVIRSFRDAKTRRLWEEGAVRKGFPAEIQKSALRKLRLIDSAAHLQDLSVPAGNRLEPLKGDRAGHSIRINDQFRICFTWVDGDAYQVEITDYH